MEFPTYKSGKLCRRCKVLEFNDKDRGHISHDPETGERFLKLNSNQITLDYDFKDKLPDLPVLAASSCPFCAFLRERIIHYYYQRRHVKQGSNVRLRKIELFFFQQMVVDDEGNENPVDRANVFFSTDNGGKSSSELLRLEVETKLTDPCAKWLRIMRRPTARNAVSESGLARIRQMVQMAEKECPPSRNHSSLPTRLVYVGNERKKPRLVISKKHAPLNEARNYNDRRYIALSYCWGPPEQAKGQLKTTRNSLEDHMRGFEIRDFPKTVLDAFLLCRALGVHYIWVDALCIIQGDQKDWEKESAAMANVYSNSFLTVAAARGDSCQSGFLKAKHHPPQVDVSFRSSLDRSISGKFSIVDPGGCLREISRETDIDALNTKSDDDYAVPHDIQLSRWNERGWTFQEVKFSSRLLLFCDKMSYLHANDIFFCENGTYQSIPFIWGRSLTKGYGNLPDPNKVHEDWCSVVESYTERSLTQPGDILTAISALAQLFSTRIPGRYLAGLWETHLHHGLLWAPMTRKGISPSPQYTAPSWSWAYQTGWVRFVGGPKEAEFEPLSAQTDVGTEDPFGQVSGGYISISAKTWNIPPAVFIKKDWTRNLTSLDTEMRLSTGQYLAHVKLDSKRLELDIENMSSSTNLSMVLISSQQNRGEDSESMLGLFVEPTDDPNEFKRVGLFASEDRDLGGRKFWDKVKSTNITLI